jgi:pyridoxal phosphate enzyme (YggS family)
MAALAERLLTLRTAIAQACARSGRPHDAVTLVAVSKLQPLGAITQALHAGQCDFGENYAQELRDKDRELAGDPLRAQLRWHFIGPLQRNKVHLVVGRAGLIHSVDSRELVLALSARAARHRQTEAPGADFVQDCLVQISLAGEEQKAGCLPAELPALLDAIAESGTLRCRGLMCMPPAAEDPEAARPYFRRLRELRDEQAAVPRPRVQLHELSMGMSHDYEVAIAEGATLVRVGTALFGARPQAA